MSLPKSPEKNTQKKHAVEAILLPLGIGLILLTGLFVGFFLPKNKDKKLEDKPDVNTILKSTSVKSADGKTITIAPRVEQITAEALKADIETTKIWTVVFVGTGEEWKDPHIKGSIFFTVSSFNSGSNLDKNGNYVIVSKDGYDSAFVADKLITQGFARNKVLNLEGGLETWKKKGFPLEK